MCVGGAGRYTRSICTDRCHSGRKVVAVMIIIEGWPCREVATKQMYYIIILNVVRLGRGRHREGGR